ncbi:hypothetical protein R1flu_025271 [Riccia fluitans]|uniref:peroxidase n=1 Tax=Riccia fluitans TaxID=41844 RepID=A0ABD1XX99_9MARC
MGSTVSCEHGGAFFQFKGLSEADSRSYLAIIPGPGTLAQYVRSCYSSLSAVACTSLDTESQSPKLYIAKTRNVIGRLIVESRREEPGTAGRTTARRNVCPKPATAAKNSASSTNSQRGYPGDDHFRNHHHHQQQQQNNNSNKRNEIWRRIMKLSLENCNRVRVRILLLLVGVVVCLSSGCNGSEGTALGNFSELWTKGSLSIKFYDQTCPQFQGIVKAGVTAALNNDLSIAGSLIRMAFHDCFVRGCDASILLDSTPTQPAEKSALPNQNSLRGFEVFDNIKATMESVCPGVVSCADIIALVARDSVVATGGPNWNVYFGRKDGFFSSQQEANSQTPAPTMGYSQLMAAFANVGLSQHDLVTLSGAHTLGRAQCFLFQSRLYNFTGQGDTDPSIEPAFASQLKQICPPNAPTASFVPLDGTQNVFDRNYYTQLLAGRGVFQSDAALITERYPRSVVMNISQDPTNFLKDFPVSMNRMLAIGVLTGTQGEIRKQCRVINS